MSSLKFLLDENVNISLFKYLKSVNLDVKQAPKSSSDSKLAEISKVENRILVTNDQDFSQYTQDQIYSVIWLKIPQSEVTNCIDSFKKLLTECTSFTGNLITLKTNEWVIEPLFEKITPGIRQRPI